MKQRGAQASTLIGYTGPDVEGSVRRQVLVVDRKAAYFWEFKSLQEFPWLKETCCDLENTLRRLKSVRNEDLRQLCGATHRLTLLPVNLKALYKVLYGTLANPGQVDARMPANLVHALKAAADIVRRRNALLLLRHKDTFDALEGVRVLGFFTDSLVLQGSSPDQALEVLGVSPGDTSSPKWKVEFCADVAVFGPLNCHVMLDNDDKILARPHRMLDGELAQWKKEEDKSAALSELRAALRGMSEESLATLRDRFPPKLDIANPEGKLRQRVPSVWRLLDAVARRRAERTRRKRSLPPQAKALQEQATNARFGRGVRCVVATEHQGYRTFENMPPETLPGCVGKPCHQVLAGEGLGFRGFVDWDDPDTPLEGTQELADRLRAHWLKECGVQTNVEVLRTHTHRTDPKKQHATHVVFIATHEGKEYLFRNVSDIPKALGLDDRYDLSVYARGRTMRLPGCPNLGKGMASAHVPLGVGCNWHPTPEEYLRWCFCVPVDRHVVWGSAPSSSSSSAVFTGTQFLFPHERWVVEAWWACLRQSCADTHTLSRESFDYGVRGTSWYQFLLRVDVKRRSDGKFLDLADFTLQYLAPRLQGARALPVSSCHHRTHNKSYVLVAMGVLPLQGADMRTGSLLHFRAKTHMPHSPSAAKKRKIRKIASQPYLGETLACTETVIGQLCEHFGAQHTFAEFRQSRRRARDLEDDEIAVSVQVPALNSGAAATPRTRRTWQVSPWFVRLVLWKRHGHLSGQEEDSERESSWHDAQRMCAAVAFLVAHAPRSLALRAVLTELKDAAARKEHQAAVAFLEAEKTRVLAKTEQDAEEQDAELHDMWTPVLAFAGRVVYKNNVY